MTAYKERDTETEADSRKRQRQEIAEDTADTQAEYGHRDCRQRQRQTDKETDTSEKRQHTETNTEAADSELCTNGYHSITSFILVN